MRNGVVAFLLGAVLASSAQATPRVVFDARTACPIRSRLEEALQAHAKEAMGVLHLRPLEKGRIEIRYVPPEATKQPEQRRTLEAGDGCEAVPDAIALLVGSWSRLNLVDVQRSQGSGEVHRSEPGDRGDPESARTERADGGAEGESTTSAHSVRADSERERESATSAHSERADAERERQSGTSTEAERADAQAGQGSATSAQSARADGKSAGERSTSTDAQRADGHPEHDQSGASTQTQRADAQPDQESGASAHTDHADAQPEHVGALPEPDPTMPFALLLFASEGTRFQHTGGFDDPIPAGALRFEFPIQAHFGGAAQVRLESTRSFYAGRGHISAQVSGYELLASYALNAHGQSGLRLHAGLGLQQIRSWATGLDDPGVRTAWTPELLASAEWNQVLVSGLFLRLVVASEVAAQTQVFELRPDTPVGVLYRTAWRAGAGFGWAF